MSVSEEQIEDLLCSAFEGGSGYWARVKKGKEPKKKCEYTFQCPLRGGSFIVVDLEDSMTDKEYQNGGVEKAKVSDHGVYEVGIKEIKCGLQKMSELAIGEGGHHFLNVLRGETDAETGDVFLQCCIFGKIVYG